MRFDTHCHLDAEQFDLDRDAVIERAQRNELKAIVIPAVHVANFKQVRELAHSFEQGFYALGIHPMCVQDAQDDHLEILETELAQHRHDPKLVAVGEIGLDFFIPEISTGEPRVKQERFYSAQLGLAQKFDLPVLLHVRRSQDILLKYLRRQTVRGGIAHAFNGSLQQARQFVALGFALGMGGAMTYTRALQIRRIANQLPLEALVLETDAPDIPPAWLHEQRRNEPYQVVEIGNALAKLRGETLETVLEGTASTAMRVLPGLAGLATIKTQR